MTSSAEHVYTPTELNREIRLHLEMGFPRIALEAEISNLSRPASGHLYFSLKDEKAQIRCALFRSSAARLPIRPENGMKVLARGRISLYEPRGDYQMIVDELQDAGEGQLQRQFEQLKKKLEAEGLFDAAFKQQTPAYPRQVGLITSPGGAAVRDMIHVLDRRWPLARVRLYPVLVQGNEAAAEIREAIEAANRQAWADVLIAGRGGGSLEDLAAFNDEDVARAVFASSIPIVSAVGHETDFSICDFVADLRAPTPSAAAELITPDQAVLKESFSRLSRQLQRRVKDRLNRETQRLDHAGHRLRQKHPEVRLREQAALIVSKQAALIRNALQLMDLRVQQLANLSARLKAQHPGRMLHESAARVDRAEKSITSLISSTLTARRQKLQDLARTMNAVSPLQVISRGYAVLTPARGGSVISSVDDTSAGESVIAQLKDGRLQCTVDAVSDEKPDSEVH